MHRSVRPPGLVLVALLSLAGCGQKGPLCLQEPKPATVPPVAAAIPGSGGADSAAAPVSPLPAAAPAAAPVRPAVPGYTRCH